MPYYHDKLNKKLICAPDEPNVIEKKNRQGDPEGWEIWAVLEITRADNFINPKTGRLMYALREIRRDRYDSRVALHRFGGQALGDYLKSENGIDGRNSAAFFLSSIGKSGWQ